MNLTYILQNKVKALIVAFAAVLLGILIGFLTSNTGAVPYAGEDTQPSPVPAFNIYTGVPDEGNESDFFKGKRADDTSASVNNVVSTCETGTQFKLRAYVHNGASDLENDNGNGPSVAKDTKIKVNLPGNEASEFVPEATISSSNASSISDTMSITCSDGRVVTISYVAGTAEQFSPLSGVQPVSDSIVTTGAHIGTMSPNGDMWGCWDQRVWVTLIVEVTEVPEKLHPAVCTALLTTIFASNSQITINEVTFEANDAQVNNVTINYGDGTVNTYDFNELPQTHTYGDPDTYTVRATLNTVFEGEADEVSSPDCTAEITIDEPEKPNPHFACEDFRLDFNDRKATVSFVPKATNGAVFKDANIVYIANGNEVNSNTIDTVGEDGRVSDMYTFAENVRNADVNATVYFHVEGQDQPVSDECGGEGVLAVTTPPTPTTPPTTIPDTGAGSIAGLLAAVTAAGTVAHRKFTLRRQ